MSWDSLIVVTERLTGGVKFVLRVSEALSVLLMFGISSSSRGPSFSRAAKVSNLLDLTGLELCID